MRNFLSALSCVVILALSNSAPRAMNWEGHDDWLENQSHSKALRDHFPKPLIREYSSCDDIKARLKDNPYEQRPLPGKNCFDADFNGDETD